MQNQASHKQRPAERQHEKPQREHAAGSGRRRGRASEEAGTGLLRTAVYLPTLLLILLSWLDEILDVPHLVFNSPPTPVNWLESVVESALALVAGTLIYALLSRMLKRTQAGEQQRKSQKIIADILLNESPTLFLAFDPDGSVILMSQALLDKIGYTMEEVVGKDYLALLIPPKDREEAARKIARLMETGAPATGENVVLSRDGKEYLLQWEARASYKETGELDFIYGPGIDITEQKKAELALRESEERYRLFMRNLAGIAYSNSLDLTSLFIHGEAEEITGYTTEELTSGSMTVMDIIHPEDIGYVSERIEQLRKIPNHFTEIVYRIFRKDGQLRWIRDFARNICNESGEPIALQGMVYDFTAAKEAEETLSRSQARYRLLVEHLKDIVWAVDKNFAYTYVSPTAEQMFGYTAEEIMCQPLESSYRGESRQTVLNYVAEAIRSMEKGEVSESGRTATFEAERACKDGSSLWVEITAGYIFDEDGKPVGVAGVTRDISERKRAEEALRKSEERYRLLAENLTAVIWSMDKDLNLTYISPSVEKMRGFTVEEAMTLPREKMFTSSSLEKMKELYSIAVARIQRGEVPAGNISRTIEVELFRKDGSTFWAELTASYLFDDKGKPAGVVGVTRDISERKKAEEALKKSEERYRLLAENITDVIWSVDKDFRYTYVSPSVEKMRGYTMEEAMQMTQEQVYTESSYHKMQAILADARERREKAGFSEKDRTRTFTHEMEFTCKDGSTCWGEVTTSYLFDAEGNPAGFVGVTRDISERKKAEEVLRQSQERYRLLAEHVNDVIWSMDNGLNIVYLSPSVEKLTGFTVEEILATPMEQWFVGKSFGKVSRILDASIEMVAKGYMPENKGALTFEVEINCKDGSTKWVEVKSVFVEDEKGKPSGGVGVARDITDRKKSEEALRRSEETYRTIFESTGTAMVIVQDDDTLYPVNEEFEKLSGYSREEIEGVKPWQEFIHPEDLDRLFRIRGLRFASPEEAPKNYTFRMFDRQGNIKHVQTTVEIIPKTKLIVMSLQDITESMRADEELKVSREQLRNLLKHSQDVRERERTRVAREIHDELGQVLTGLKLDLSFLAKKLPPDLTELVTKTNLMLRFVDMTIQSVKRITMDLRPGLLDHLGLVAAIEWQAEEFQRRTGIKSKVSVFPEEIVLNPDQSTSVFRIFQETLTNVSKYARATEVKISLTVKNETFEMTVSDNGVGITREQMANPKSFGLMGIQERAAFSGGTARIFGQKGKGTTVKLTIPLDDVRSIHDTSTHSG